LIHWWGVILFKMGWNTFFHLECPIRQSPIEPALSLGAVGPATLTNGGPPHHYRFMVLFRLGCLRSNLAINLFLCALKLCSSRYHRCHPHAQNSDPIPTSIGSTSATTIRSFYHIQLYCILPDWQGVTWLVWSENHGRLCVSILLLGCLSEEESRQLID
jgi:hypothetical protein